MIAQGPTIPFLQADAADPPVTVIREIHVRPGSAGPFELLMGALIEEAQRQPGHLGATVVRPHGPGAAYRFVYKFDRRSNLIAWHSSASRTELFKPIAELVESDRASEHTGLETWFELPRHFTPPRWKTTLMSWAAIYVLVVAISYLMRALGLHPPLPIGALILTVVVVPLVAYVVGPLTGRVFHRWLTVGAPEG